MAKIDILNREREKVGERELSDEVFCQEPKPHLLHSVVVGQLAGRRSGSSSTKTRSEVAGGGRKPFRQKGTGRARIGTMSSPILRGGGVVFGPKPRSYNVKINKKAKKVALRNALSLKFAEGDIIAVDQIDLSAPKTKDFVAFVDALEAKSGLIIDVEPTQNLMLASRNHPKFKVLPVKGLNVYDLLLFETIIISSAALEKIEEGLK